MISGTVPCGPGVSSLMSWIRHPMPMATSEAG